MVKNQIKKVPIKNRPGFGRDFLFWLVFTISIENRHPISAEAMCRFMLTSVSR